VKLSGPLKPASGVYVAVALSWFGVPVPQAWSADGESVPWAGGLTTENASSQLSGSVACNVTGSAVSVGVASAAPTAVGGWSAGGPDGPAMVKVSRNVPVAATYWALSCVAVTENFVNPALGLAP